MKATLEFININTGEDNDESEAFKRAIQSMHPELSSQQVQLIIGLWVRGGYD